MTAPGHWLQKICNKIWIMTSLQLIFLSNYIWSTKTDIAGKIASSINLFIWCECMHPKLKRWKSSFSRQSQNSKQWVTDHIHMSQCILLYSTKAFLLNVAKVWKAKVDSKALSQWWSLVVFFLDFGMAKKAPTAKGPKG